MLKQESNNIGSEENTRARACDTCRSTVCTVYCHADSAYLCTSCDTQVHSANRVASRHKRVPICESCECAPAAFLCEADDASLCTACDSDVHSANTVARRHHRVPVLPSSGNSYSSKASHHQTETTVVDPVVHQEEGDAKEAVYENSNQNNGENSNQNNGLLFSDEYLDLADYNFKFTGQYNQHQQDCDVAQTNYGGDRVVPLQIHEESKGNLRHKQHNITHGSSENHYIYNGSINHNGNNTNMETDFVPEPTARDTEAARSKTPKGKPEQQLPDPLIIQLSPMDREARVLRYREKRKARKFEKTIRYASRKAYAERRPRINGRFAKMSETEEDYDQGFNSVLMLDTGYGTVPSF